MSTPSNGDRSDTNQSRLSQENTTTIAISTTTSAAIVLGRNCLAQITFPDAFTGTTVDIHGSQTLNGTYTPIYTTLGLELLQLTVSASESRSISIDPAKTAGYKYIKLVASSQAAARLITFTTITAF